MLSKIGAWQEVKKELPMLERERCSFNMNNCIKDVLFTAGDRYMEQKKMICGGVFEH